jgi:Ca2+-binding RTX toxin-like protein
MPTPSGFSFSLTSSLTGVKAVDSLLAGSYWLGSNWTIGGPTNLSYSFVAPNTSYFVTNYSPDNEYKAIYTLSSDQRGAVINALATWSSVANISFTQTTDDITNVGDLRFGGYSLMKDQAAAWAYIPSNSPKGGDVWIGDPSDPYPIKGTYDYLTFIHEIGHAIGLKHPFSPNALNSTILDPSLDDVRYTVMSYNSNYSYLPTTPMVLDILAIQSLYGANTHYQAGDTVYRWDSNKSVFETIWDSGGTDTIDASNQLSGVSLDLNEGAFSSIGIAFNYYADGTTYAFNSGLAIAFGSQIENATGSTFNDILKGNALNNVLDGGTGADTMSGGAGNDTYYVDNANDVVIETGTSNTEIDSVFSTVSYNLTFSPNVENLTLLTNGNLNAYGNASNNTLTGNAGNNILDGGTGADTLIGGAGNDTYIVDNTNDVIIETSTQVSEIDTVQASASFTLSANLENLTLTGTDNIYGIGNTQNNVLIGNTGNNILNGGAGLDTLIGGKGNDEYILDQSGELSLVQENASEGNDTLYLNYNATAQDSTVNLGVGNLQNFENVQVLGAGAFNVIGNDLDNVLTGNASVNTLQGGLGNDTLNGGAGADLLVGGVGNDTYVVDDAADSVVEAANEGTDLVQTSISYTLAANVENGQLLGNAQINLTGNELNNSLAGNSANNILDGGAGADIMEGGAGNDTYYVDNVGDVVTEYIVFPDQVDTVIASIDYTLGNNVENLTLSGSSNLNGTGNSLNNVITGNSGNNILDGGAGTDWLIGGTGNDTYIVDNVGDVVSETSTIVSEIDNVLSSVNLTLGANLENLTLTGSANIDAVGNTQNNVLTGNTGNNTLNGMGGADTMDGGAGNDAYVVDNIGDVVIEQGTSASEVDTVYSYIDYTLGANVENLTLIGANVNGTGNSLNNTLKGSAGNNVLDGGAGADFMAGDTGNDTYIVDNIGDVVSETSTLASEIDTVQSSVTFNLGANLENLTLTGNANINGTGNNLNNTLIGNAGNNVLFGGAGADFMAGGAGEDLYYVDNIGDVVSETSTVAGEIDTVSSIVTFTLGANVENLVLGGNANLNGYGNNQNNAISGNAGDNILDGMGGADTLDGGAGNDSYVVDNVGDVVIEQGTSTSEIDTVYAYVDYTLSANVENLTLIGANVNGTGNTLNNTLKGSAGNNVLDGGAGADFMAGDTGNDTYIVDNVGDVVSETSTLVGEIDTVRASVNWTLGANLENLTFTGSANLNGSGNTLNNVLTGNDGNNILDGDLGIDTMIGGKGNDAYALDQSAELTLLQENANEGTDTLYLAYNATAQDSVVNLSAGNLQNVENVVLVGTGAFTVIGNTLDNALTGNASNNTLQGGAGNDILDGGAGADSLQGGTGNDIYIVDNIADAVVEGANEGTDLVKTTVSYTLSDNVENLTLTGNASLNGYGNSQNNVLTGNASDNILDGMAGADTLDGGAGNDAYVVDNVGDVVIEQGTSASEIDTVYSYIDYTLGTNVENLTLIGANVNGTGNSLNNTLKGSAGNNILDGGAGADFMAGDTGNDTYIVDNVGDVVSETSTLAGEIDTVRSSVNFTLGANLENLTLTGSADLNGSGNTLNNVLTGNDGNNILDGGLGIDTMIGGKGNDAYALDQSAELTLLQENANEGTDTLYLTFNANQGSVVNLDLSNLQNVENLLLLGTGAFTAYGNSLDNTITGNASDNILDGKAGADTLIGGAGNDAYVVDNAGDVIVEQGTSTSEIDTVYSYIDYTLGANVENLTLIGANLNGTGNSLNNVLKGSVGNNILDGGAGADFMAGDIGNDTYIVDNVGDVVSETSTLVGEIDNVVSSVSFTLGANVENLTLTGNASLNGYGNSQNNVLTGNSGDNILDGMGGADTLDGGAGNDAYVVDNIGDVVIEQGSSPSEVDTVYSYIDYTLGTNVENLTLIGGNLNGTGNSLNNTLKGSAGNNILDGGAGADFMAGDTGNDTYIVDNAGDVVSETSTLASEIDTVRSSLNWTLGANLENLTLTGSANLNGTGNTFNNVLIGNSGNNIIDGGAGADFMAGDTGNDTYFVDNVGDVVSETSTLVGEIDSVVSSVTFALGANVENLTLTGNASLNGYGNSQNNVLTGNASDNILDGMAGADTLDGGAGNDAYVVDNVGDVVIEQGTSASEIDTVYSYIDYTLGTNVENLTLIGANVNGTGNSLNNTLKGSAGNNILDGGAGADFMAGDTGNDTYIVDNVGDVVSETSTLAGEIDTVRSSVNFTLGANLENLTLTGSADLNGSGNTLNNVLTGNDGNNILDGGLGIDTMIGGKGNDAYALDQSAELTLLQENANEGTDTLYLTFNANQGSVVNLDLSNLQNVENLLLLGTGAFTAYGNSLDNTITGNASDNILDGKAGADTLIGGAGNDAYVVDNAGDVIVEQGTSTSEIDTVYSYIDYTLGANVENLTLIGANLNGTGNSLNNVLKGSVGNNILDGGAGADFMAGDIGNDTYIVDNVGDVVSETSTLAGEIDTVRSSVNFTLGANLENLTLTGSADLNGSGNTLNNVVTGNDGNNILDGGLGIDTMIGGKGNDAYALDQSAELTLLQENTNEGIDTLYLTFNATAQDNVVNLGASNLVNVENILLLGTGAFTALGNSLNNSITGNGQNNILDGGAGADTLTGGAGSDTFVFGAVNQMGTGANRDVITDFSSLQGDKIDLTKFDADLLQGGFNGFTFIGANEFTGAGQVRFVDHVLSGNVSGNAGADFEIQLVGVNTFSANDLVA